MTASKRRKRQNYGDGNKISGCQREAEGEGGMSR